MTDYVTKTLANIQIQFNNLFPKHKIDPPTNSSGTNVSTTNIHHHYHDDRWFPWFYPQQQIIVHNTSTTKKSRKEDEDKSSPILGMLVIGGAVLGGVAIIANDEYDKFRRSNIHDLMVNLKEYHDTFRARGLLDKYFELDRAYDKWYNLFAARTYHARTSKFSGAASVMAMGTGLYLGASAILTTGFIGLIGSTAYIAWKSLSSNTLTEERALEDLLKCLVHLKEHSEISANAPVANMNYDPNYNQSYSPIFGTNLHPGSYYPDTPVPIYQPRPRLATN